MKSVICVQQLFRRGHSYSAIEEQFDASTLSIIGSRNINEVGKVGEACCSFPFVFTILKPVAGKMYRGSSMHVLGWLENRSHLASQAEISFPPRTKLFRSEIETRH